MLAEYSEAQLEALWWDWRFWARPNQLEPPGDWVVWLQLAGRGFGKTRSGAEWIRDRVKQGARRIAFVAQTPGDARDVMVEGESGILAVSPPHERPNYEPSKRRLTWKNGAVATIYSAFEPDQLRGPNHDTAWADELASWEYGQETWDMLMFGLRIGDKPRVVVTTTPKPVSLIRMLAADPTVAVTTGSTYENLDNLSPSFFQRVVTKYEGTSLGEQELHAKILTEAPGALWTRETLAKAKVDASGTPWEKAPDLVRVVVGVDPAAKNKSNSNETGIIIAGVDTRGHGWVVGDRSARLSPDGWGRRVCSAYDDHEADRVVAETNNGGDMVAATIRTVDPKVAIREVTASRGKHTRAEPVAALYEQGKVHHVGNFPALEDQLCTWVPGDTDDTESPDRLDALVWALTDLMVSKRPIAAVSPGTVMGVNEYDV